jgi:subtilisin family serine protease
VVVAVIDTGIDTSHPDLDGTVISGVDLSGVGAPGGNAPVGSSSFHGTMVASLIAGQGSEASGVRGVAPDVDLLSISIGLGVAGADTDDQIAKGIIWAVDHGADIINLSLTRNSQTWPESWDEALLYAFAADVVVVAASGNRSDGSLRPSAPATIPGVVSVGGVTQNGDPSQLVSEGLNIAIAAPSDALFGSYPGETYREWGGSSGAAPIVSGLLAQMIQADPQASANDLVARLTETATDLGAAGFDASFGFGVINPEAAITSRLTSYENPLGSLADWVELYRPSQVDQASELVTPATPEPRAGEQSTVEPETNISIEALEESSHSIWLNPLLYWVLVSLASMLWFVLRLRRRDLLKAKNQTKGKPQHDSSDN